MIRFLVNTPEKRVLVFMLASLSIFTPIAEYQEYGSIGSSYIFWILWIPYVLFSYLEYRGVWK